MGSPSARKRRVTGPEASTASGAYPVTYSRCEGELGPESFTRGGFRHPAKSLFRRVPGRAEELCEGGIAGVDGVMARGGRIGVQHRGVLPGDVEHAMRHDAEHASAACIE